MNILGKKLNLSISLFVQLYAFENDVFKIAAI